MRGEDLLNEHNVVHYIGPSKIDKNGEIHRVAFRLPKGKTDLSVSWLEYFDTSVKEEQLAQVRRCMKGSSLTLRPAGALAELNVGTTREEVYDQYQFTIRFVHDPIEHNPSHTLIIDLPAHDSGISKRVSYLIGLLAIKYPAVQCENS